MHPLLNSWQLIFTKRGFNVDLNQVNVPERRQKENFPLVWPVELAAHGVVALFKASVQDTLGFAAFVPNHMSDFEHVRDTRSGTYVHWVTSSVYKEAGQLVSTDEPLGEQITLPELYLYHTWMIEIHGKAYGSVVGSGSEFCQGTTYLKKPDASPALEWDPQDIKVVLRHGFRDPANYERVLPQTAMPS